MDDPHYTSLSDTFFKLVFQFTLFDNNKYIFHILEWSPIHLYLSRNRSIFILIHFIFIVMKNLNSFLIIIHWIHYIYTGVKSGHDQISENRMCVNI